MGVKYVVVIILGLAGGAAVAALTAPGQDSPPRIEVAKSEPFAPSSYKKWLRLREQDYDDCAWARFHPEAGKPSWCGQGGLP